MSEIRFSGAVGCVLLSVGCAVALAAGAQAQGLFGGAAAPAFTAAQAAQGKTLYDDNCSSCHGGALDDGQFAAALKGEVFQSHWRGQPPEALFTYIQTKMPPSGPGTLSARAYTDIQAYILAANGVRPGGEGVAAAPAAPAARPAGSQAERPQVGRDAIYEAELARRAARLQSVAPVSEAIVRSPPDGDWLSWRRTADSQGFSPLKQINKANVGRLRTAWSWSLPLSRNEHAPLVHDGVMFIASANTVQALDAATGDLLWQYIRALPDELENGREWKVKSLAIYGERLYAPTADGHMVALEVKTGKLAWDRELLTSAQMERRGQPPGNALALDGGPIIARGKVIVGVALGVVNGKGGCFIVALDAATGEEVWRFNTVDQSPPGTDSWNGAPVNERYGGGVWTAGSYDPALGLVYFGIGNTYDAATLLLPHAQKGASNDGLYTAATVALDAETGALKWHYQHVKRDVWDLDWVFEQTLMSMPVNGRPRDLVVTGGKIALFDAVDRATGQYLFSRDVGLQNLVVAIDPVTGHKTTNPEVEPEANKPKLLCPSSSGARSWPATAYNPTTRILYVPLIESCADYTWTPGTPAQIAAGGVDMRFSTRVRPGADGKVGRIEAINLETGKVVWSMRQRAPVASSMLATAGGLVFNGALDRRFRAYDEANGKVLWETRLNATPSSSPVTYAVGGRQYVAVMTGGGGAFDSAGRALAPEIDSPAGGTTVTVFELPEGR